MAIKIAVPKARSAPALPPGLASDFSLVREQFPKIADKITALWGSVVLQEYLSKTIFDERGGRQGFPMPVVSALMRIFDYHGTLMPENKTEDNWGHVV
ncbi:hypothetical protein [Sideroxydans lithotrophicus]|uniref:Uncharacterized protein n=1 Tax=Sideroxydans lithotrophicus (strain ES-1) TaxID=580332 RepID=D5CNJ5_SIDLE|nr:hypothetical protein [Sideroxydans lithotrophicus]ADE10908.1 hypothetical protein Slit_0668 [Sideroxydans lithotrophicus ES-1]